MNIATLCLGSNHVQQLKKGGEFLTQVRLLIDHLNLYERFQMPPNATDSQSRI